VGCVFAAIINYLQFLFSLFDLLYIHILFPHNYTENGSLNIITFITPNAMKVNIKKVGIAKNYSVQCLGYVHDL
jgi:hypothetical protein